MEGKYAVKLSVTYLISRLVGNEGNVIMVAYAYGKCKCGLTPVETDMSVIVDTVTCGLSLCVDLKVVTTK